MLRPSRLEWCLDLRLAESRLREAPFGAVGCMLGFIGIPSLHIIPMIYGGYYYLSAAKPRTSHRQIGLSDQARHGFSRKPITVHDNVVFIRTWGSPYRKTVCDEREH